MNAVARDLIAAFQASEQNESAAILIDDEGFDFVTIRVLTAWWNSDHDWVEPTRPCPDDGQPTARAYAWLMSGASIDYVAIADAAGVSRAQARQRMAQLLGNRLIYPDGQMAKVAKASMQATIAKRVRAAARKVEPKKADAN